jgi:hypothetical protein
LSAASVTSTLGPARGTLAHTFRASACTSVRTATGAWAQGSALTALSGFTAITATIGPIHTALAIVSLATIGFSTPIRLAAICLTLPTIRLDLAFAAIYVTLPTISLAICFAFASIPRTVGILPSAAVTVAPDGAPTGALPVKWPTPVIAVPVRVEWEDDDRQANAGAILHNRHIPLLIEVRQLITWDPPARIPPAYVAPPISSNAAMDCDPGVVGNAIHYREVERGTCPQIGGFRRHRR